MTTSPDYDVAVIGGGLAGLCLAIQCAEANFRVILFEKETYPFHKVCGEYISNESRAFLTHLGVNADTLKLPDITNLLLSDATGRSYHFALPLGGFGISRYFLDELLYKIAVAKGAKIVTGSRVVSATYQNDVFTLSTSEGHVTARVATGSFGKRSNLDVKWQRPFVVQKPNALNNYIGVKYHVSFNHNPNEIALHNFSNGYCGLSKIEGDKSCLCYLTTADNLRKNGNSIKKMEEQVLFKNPALKEIFTSATFLFDQPNVISQVSFSQKSQVENHILLLGDSAGLITPLCGNGMSMAMHASKLAFREVSNYLAGRQSRTTMEKNYGQQWNKEFSKRLLIGRTIQRFFGNNLSTSLFLRAMHACKPMASRLIAMTYGKPF